MLEIKRWRTVSRGKGREQSDYLNKREKKQRNYLLGGLIWDSTSEKTKDRVLEAEKKNYKMVPLPGKRKGGGKGQGGPVPASPIRKGLRSN